MKKTAEYSVDNLTCALAPRGYWYQGEMKIGKKETVKFNNFMVDGYDLDCCFNFRYTKKRGLFSKEVEIEESHDDLGFEPPRKNGRLDEDIANEYMQDIMGCFDIKTLKFDKERALEIKKQYEQAKHDNWLKDNAKNNTKTHKKVETKVQVENEDKNL